MKRRSFTQEFKRQAVLLVLNEGLPVQTVSKKLEVHRRSAGARFVIKNK
ncbi:transposase [Enterococcus devriesei]|nr:transposase [Enterococcus devriesei]MDT2822983.1 transposase [Enterococcus devriesei]